MKLKNTFSKFIPWKGFNLQGFWPWQYVLQNYHLGGAKKHISINLKTQEMQPEWKKLLFARNQIELIFTNCNFDGVSARIKEALPSFQVVQNSLFRCIFAHFQLLAHENCSHCVTGNKQPSLGMPDRSGQHTSGNSAVDFCSKLVLLSICISFNFLSHRSRPGI